MKYRVDTVPRLVRPIYLGITSLLGFLIFAWCMVCRWTCRMETQGQDQFDANGNFIYCLWHECYWPYFTLLPRLKKRQIWINHPAAYMRPVHLAVRWLGVERLIMGSSGEEGKLAVNALSEALKQGNCSTAISPDGPAGPPRVLKKGVLYLALKSGVPVLPIHCRSWPYIPIPSWDGKKIPLPFGKIKVTYGEPIRMTPESSFDLIAQKLTTAMSPKF